MSSSFKWALDPNIYSIPKPFGEVTEWMVYERNEDTFIHELSDEQLQALTGIKTAKQEETFIQGGDFAGYGKLTDNESKIINVFHDDAKYYIVCLIQKTEGSIEEKEKCLTNVKKRLDLQPGVGSTENIEIFERGRITNIMVRIKHNGNEYELAGTFDENETCAVQVNDKIMAKTTFSTTIIRDSGVIIDMENPGLFLKFEISGIDHQKLLQQFELGPDDIPASQNWDDMMTQENIKIGWWVTCELWYYKKISVGWTGDVTQIHKKNLNSDPDRIMLQVTSEIACSENRQSQFQGVYSTAVDTTKWGAMHTVMCKLDEAASNMVTDEIIRMSAEREKEWVSKIKQIQDAINAAIKTDLTKENKFFAVVQEVPPATILQNDRVKHKLKILKDDKYFDVAYAQSPEVTTKTGPLTVDLFSFAQPNPPLSFFDQKQAKCDVDAIVNNIFTKPRPQKTTHGKRLALMSGSDMVPSFGDFDDAAIVNNVPKVDLKSEQFEYDINSTDFEQFMLEYKTCLSLIGQCLVSTIDVQSKANLLIHANLKHIETGPGKTDLPQPVKESFKTFKERQDIINMNKSDTDTKSNPETIDEQWWAIDVESSLKIQQAFDDYPPSMNSFLSTVGACSHLLWKPLVKSMSKSETSLTLANLGSFIVSTMPFGAVTQLQQSMIDTIVRYGEIDLKSTEDMVFLTRNDEAEDMPYEPVFLKYGISFTDNFENMSWSIGSLSTLFLESLMLVMIFLQKLVNDEAHDTDSINQMQEVEHREKVSAWDSYPGGFMSYKHDTPFRKLGLNDPGIKIYDINGLKFGNKVFSQYRDAVQKEIQYASSYFDFKSIPTTDSKIRNDWKSIVWTEVNENFRYIAIRDLNPQTGTIINTGISLLSFQLTNPTTEWSNFIPMKLFDVINHEDYRAYTGAQIGRSGIPKSEKEYQEKHINIDTFDASVKNVRYTFPGIELGTRESVLNHNEDNKFAKLGKWLKNTFVGWAFSNMKSMDRVVSAVACNKFKTLIIDYFNEKDLRYNEPKGVNMFSKEPHDQPLINLMKIVFSEQQKIMGQHTTSSLVIPGVVLVKDGGPSALTTKCTTKQYLVKTDAFRVVESELWSTLKTRLVHIRGMPPGSYPRCLAALLKVGDRYKTKVYTINELLRLKPEASVALARLMVAIRISNNTWTNTSKYRYGESVQMGTFFSIHMIYAHTLIIPYYIVGAAYIEEAIFDVLFRL